MLIDRVLGERPCRVGRGRQYVRKASHLYDVGCMPATGPFRVKGMDRAALNASSPCCGQMKWICVSKPPAVRIFPSPAMASVPGPIKMVTFGWMSGLPALPMPKMRPSFSPTSALTMPQVVEN